MGNFGVPFLVIGVLAILVVDIFSVSYMKTALLGMRMRKPGFFFGSVGICVASIILSLIMVGAFLKSPVKAEIIEAPRAGVAQQEEVESVKEKAADSKQEEAKEPETEGSKIKEKEIKVPELTQTTVVASTVAAAPVVQTSAVSFEVWQGYYRSFSYNFIEIENGTPYVYMPVSRGNFRSDLNNIVNNREGGNIIVMVNAGVYNATTTDPLGTTIQNKKVMSQAGSNNSLPQTLVVDEFGNVGYTVEKIENGVANYIDAKTGETVKNRKIVSAVYAFTPIMVNKKAVNKTSVSNYGDYRARQVFCVKQDSYVIITNTGEGIDGGGWDFDDMVQVANYRGCLSAFNLDGGGSTATAYRTALNKNFSILASTERHDPTFIVFTADNLAPRGR